MEGVLGAGQGPLEAGRIARAAGAADVHEGAQPEPGGQVDELPETGHRPPADLGIGPDQAEVCFLEDVAAAQPDEVEVVPGQLALDLCRVKLPGVLGHQFDPVIAQRRQLAEGDGQVALVGGEGSLPQIGGAHHGGDADAGCARCAHAITFLAGPGT